MAASTGTSAASLATLRLLYGTTELVLDKPNVSIVLGRDAGCNIAVSDRMASRHHARIERRRDKFYLVDQSTNGTYVVFVGEAEIALRREEVMLRGTGRIAFGRSCQPDRRGNGRVLRCGPERPLRHRRGPALQQRLAARGGGVQQAGRWRGFQLGAHRRVGAGTREADADLRSRSTPRGRSNSCPAWC